MNNQETIKRLFFGMEVHAPWPTKYPYGRLLDENHRHLTLAFLGNIPFQPLLDILPAFPLPSMKVGSVGFFDECLTLPPRHPNVVAWHAQWWNQNPSIMNFQSLLSEWLISAHYSIDDRPWKPHVTLCRQPFDHEKWIATFTKLPFYTTDIHLFESKGNLQYLPIWSYPIKPPFEEIDHTADMAFIIRGENLQQLYLHAFTSLAFKAPYLLEFFNSEKLLKTLDDLIIALNEVVAQADQLRGCPLKAVSFHGEIVLLPDGLLQWEMIVDV